MWRHHPQTLRLVELLERIGEVRLVRASFSFALDSPGDHRWLPEQEGGALMDVGTYCVNAARLLCGEPDEARGTSLGEGVDARFAGVLRFDGALATFDCGFDLPARSQLEVIGACGSASQSWRYDARTWRTSPSAPSATRRRASASAGTRR